MKIFTWRRLIAVLVFVGLFLLLLPRLASRWHRDTVPDGQAPEPLQVNLATLRTELEATRESLPWATAYTLAKICNAAYEDWPDDEAERRGRDFFAWGFTKVSPVKNKKQYAYVLSNDDIVVVAFRGTDDWDDFKKDAWFLSKDWHQGHIHAGFLAALQDLEEDLVATVKTHGATSKRLWITGHSLGGAMAVAFGYDCLASLGLPPSGVVTFGQPRCFDRKLGDPVAKCNLHRKYVRFVHEHDIIPWLPPPIMPYLPLATSMWERGINSLAKRFVFSIPRPFMQLLLTVPKPPSLMARKRYPRRSMRKSKGRSVRPEKQSRWQQHHPHHPQVRR